MIVEKELNAVAIGDYVVDIVKQKGTYALTSAGHIKNSKVVHHLSRKGVLSVLVDTSKAIKIAQCGAKASRQSEKATGTSFNINPNHFSSNQKTARAGDCRNHASS